MATRFGAYTVRLTEQEWRDWCKARQLLSVPHCARFFGERARLFKAWGDLPYYAQPVSPAGGHCWEGQRQLFVPAESEAK